MMSDSPGTSWPHQRLCPGDFSAAPGLQETWEFSRNQINHIKRLLTESALPSNISSIAVSGSLARMEAHRDSDLDLLVIVNDGDASASNLAFDQVWSQLDSLNIRKPKDGGIFAQPVERTRLLDDCSKGIVDESLVVFGQRMQLLIDAQPIYGFEQFDVLRRDILRWYSEHRIAVAIPGARMFSLVVAGCAAVLEKHSFSRLLAACGRTREITGSERQAAVQSAGHCFLVPVDH